MKETKLEKLKIERNKLERQISDIEYKKLVEISIPQLKESVGRCFKYRNSYGSNSKSWWLYLKILSVDEKIMSFKTIEFQQTSMDFIEIKFDQKYNFNGKNYFNVKIEIVEHMPNEFTSKTTNSIKYSSYIDGYTHCEGETMNESIKKLKDFMEL
mgnify:CR=1 FL=1